MPADFLQQVISQMSDRVLCDLERLRLKHGKVHCTSTPRRLVLIIEELSDLSDDLVYETKGPPLSQAFKDGSPTSAAVGFAKRFNLNTEDLEIRDTPKGQFLFANNIEKGKPTFNLLNELLPSWIDSFQGKRFMRWGDGERRFARPVRWIVSLLDSKIVPLKISGCDPEINSGNITRGLRLNELYLSIPSANDYYEIIENAGIVLDRNTRKLYIEDLINQNSNKHNSVPDIPQTLLEELTDLVESPSLIIGEFDPSFLRLPPEVLTTVMKVHQRYVPLYLTERDFIDPLLLDSKDTLLPLFLCISNGLLESNNRIKKGNERVLKARLSDAKFFLDTDLSISSNQRLEQLKEVSFSSGLGSLFDRSKRIQWVVELLIRQLEGPIINKEHTCRAALLCKHDLVSQVVGEFPELEGVMGGKYLLKEKEPREVALAVLEHYFPKGSGDILPQSDSGSIIALAERFELLLSIFSKGQRPSGSSDPYALRRSGNGILQILFSKSWSFSVIDFLHISIDNWSKLFPDFKINQQTLFNDLSEFFRQRIISQLVEEYKIEGDLVQAVAGKTIPISKLLSDPADILLRAELLTDLRSSGKLSLLHEVVIRASRLAEKSSLPSTVLSSVDVVNPLLFEKQTENDVLKLINTLEPLVQGKSNNRYIDLAEKLSSGSVVLSKFFDGDQSVMVMSDNLSVRSNRLNLLKILKNQASVLADFYQIST